MFDGGRARGPELKGGKERWYGDGVELHRPPFRSRLASRLVNQHCACLYVKIVGDSQLVFLPDCFRFPKDCLRFSLDALLFEMG